MYKRKPKPYQAICSPEELELVVKNLIREVTKQQLWKKTYAISLKQKRPNRCSMGGSPFKAPPIYDPTYALYHFSYRVNGFNYYSIY